MTRDEALALVERVVSVIQHDDDLSTVGLEPNDMEAFVALAQRGAEVQDAVEAWASHEVPRGTLKYLGGLWANRADAEHRIAESQSPHALVQIDCSLRRVLILPEQQ